MNAYVHNNVDGHNKTREIYLTISCRHSQKSFVIHVGYAS